MEQGYRGHQGIVHHCPQECKGPAVFPGDGAQAAGVAQAHHDGLGIDKAGKIAAHRFLQRLKQPGSRHISQNNGEHIPGICPHVAAGQHTKQNAEGNAVEGFAHDIVIGQDEQPINAHIHQENGIAVVCGNADGVVIAPQHFPVFPEAAAHQQGKHHHHPEQDEAESICNGGGADRQGLGSRGSGQLQL